MILKALILSGGTGTRLRPFTFTTTKQLLPVANRPLLFYIIDMVKQAGIKSAGIVVSTEWGNQVKQIVGDGSQWGITVEYIVQPDPTGLADAVRISRHFLDNSPFMMVLGDNLYKFNVNKLLNQFDVFKADAMVLLKGVQSPSGFGIAVMQEDGKITDVQEKPRQPRSNLAIAGIYLFSPAIHQAIAEIKPSQRGELEISDAIQQLIISRHKVYGYLLDGWWLDTGNKDDLLKANRAAMDEYMQPVNSGICDTASQISGKVAIGINTSVENSKILGPVSIAENCVIKNSQIGPYVSLGPETIVIDVSIENSIVLSNVSIKGFHSINSSIIGKKSSLDHDDKQKINSFSIGDCSKVNF